MDLSKKYGRRSFLVILTFMAVLMFCLDTGIYFGVNRLLHVLTPHSGAGANIETVSDFVRTFKTISAQFISWYLPVSALFFAFFGFILWIVLKGSVSGIFKDADIKNSLVTDRKKGKKDFADQRMEQRNKRRIFLCTLSVLQREGRLLDFFDEDLSLYNDEQIGMAVRSIQEDCKKTMARYISLKPVLDKNEGDEVVIEPGFDPDSIKLTGNVTGKPPFKGILRHRGWMAGKKEIPKLSDVRDPSVIVPAEVEVE